jgi:hypothetical protein
MGMKRVGMEASKGLELTSMDEMVLVGALLKRFTSFQVPFNGALAKGPTAPPMVYPCKSNRLSLALEMPDQHRMTGRQLHPMPFRITLPAPDPPSVESLTDSGP